MGLVSRIAIFSIVSIAGVFSTGEEAQAGQRRRCQNWYSCTACCPSPQSCACCPSCQPYCQSAAQGYTYCAAQTVSAPADASLAGDVKDLKQDVRDLKQDVKTLKEAKPLEPVPAK
jgi:hypothetical protein